MGLKPRALFILTTIVLLLSGQGTAGTQKVRPMETLQGPINEIIRILNDPSYNTSGKKAAQKVEIWKVASPIFNFNEISRRAVGKKRWARFSKDEKSRFSAVFSEFLGATYIDKLQGEFSNERIDFEKELVKGSKALVRTRLRRQSLEIPIDYRMHQVDGTWKVYDIVLEEGVSLVKNYRVQFTSKLNKITPAQLIEQLEAKLATQKASVPHQK